MKKRLISAIIAFVGLMLSPITWWNDPFVNIPISYITASIVAGFSPNLFYTSFLIFYWFSNLLGVLLLYKGGKGFIEARRISRSKQVIAILVYSFIIVLLSIYGIIKPIWK